jgi:hypothetical protein
VKCFRCQGFGHIDLDCPNRKVVTIIAGEAYELSDEELEDVEPVYDKEITPANYGELLVV